ncbi:hypothetical protein HELRODRAFT_80719, partial [Helobdella robusta]|uniref:Cytochrome P450 n=1 Tax=Helobdella robusta TaxID=6412 RepID=T1G444_HELRO
FRYVVLLNGRKTVHEALVKHSLNFSSRPMFYMDDFVNPKRSGIVKHPYDDHFKFHHRICINVLRNLGFGQGIMESRIKIEVEDLVRRIEMKNKQAFDPSFEIVSAVSNVICSIIFGKGWVKEDQEFLEGLNLMYSMINSANKSLIINFFPILRHFTYYKKIIDNEKVLFGRWQIYINKIVNRVVKTEESENFCRLYLEEAKHFANVTFDEDQFIGTITDLFAAGVDTTATTLRWFIVMMANNQDVQKKIQDELERVVGLKKVPSLENKPNLPITEAAILEVMRFKTLLPFAFPHWTTKQTIIDNILIPNNVMVMPNLYSVHMNTDDWNEPEKFKIERFLNEDQTQVVRRDLIMPFSLGKRACLGEVLAKQEIFLFASTLLQKFNIVPSEGEEKIFVTEKIGLTNTPSPYKVRFICRK